EHDVERAYYCDYVGNQRTAHHHVQRLQIYERRRAYAYAVRLRGTVADDEVSQLAFGSFDGVVNFADWRLNDLGNFRHDRAFGNFSYCLVDDAERLAHLHHANQVSVVSIAILRGGNIEVEFR